LQYKQIESERGKTMKKVLTMVLCLFVISALLLSVGCGAQSAAPATTTTTGSVASTQAATSTAPAAQPATIRLLSWWPQSQMQGSLDAFAKANPNITIDFQFGQTGDPYNSLAKTQLAAGAGPDIFVIGSNWKDFQKAGYVMDITGKPFLSNFADSGLKASNTGDKQYGVPVDSWFSGIFVNKDLATKAGVKLPFNSLDEFVAACDAFKKIGVKPLAVAGGAKQQDVWRFAFCEVFTDMYADNPNFDSDINSGKTTFAAGWTPALKNWYTLVQKGIYTKDMLGVDQAQVDAEFTTGKAAMTYGGNWSIDGWKKANPSLNITMIPWAGSKPGSIALMAGVGMSWCANAATKNQDAVLKWLDFMSTPEGLLPLQKALSCGIFLKGVKYDLAPELNDALPTLSDNKGYAPWIYWNNSTAVINSAMLSMQEVLSGKIKIDEVGAAMDKANKSVGQ
jgi:raffinose/stachyose/melibiose transport system substrate-binding protein